MIQFFSQHIDSVLVIILAAGLGLRDYFSGSGKIKREIANEYKERNEQLDSKIKELSSTVNDQGLQISRLEGSLKEKDNHIISLTTVLQGRNPEMVEILKEIKTPNIQVLDFMKVLHEKVVGELDYQTEILEGQSKTTKIKRNKK